MAAAGTPVAPGRRRAGTALVVWMALSVAAIGALAAWDQRRESAAAIDELAGEQATLAWSLAQHVALRLSRDRPKDRDGRQPISPQQLVAGFADVVRAGDSELLVRFDPASDAFVDTAGRELQAPQLARALASGQRMLRIDRAEALAMGLPARLAVAGLASIEVAPGERLGVAVVATALRERDRQARAMWRLVLSLALAAGLVGTFGGLALRKARREHKLEQDLARAELARQRDEKLDRLDKAATMLTMATGMAHELCTPLGVIVGRAEQLATRADCDERARRGASAILDQAEHINLVVRGFLDLARGEAPAMQPVAPAQLVASAVALVEHRFAAAGVQLLAELPDHLTAVPCEPRLLQHALVNLLLNACDACPRGGHVRIEAEESAGGLKLSVTDDGSGISTNDLQRATEPFFTTKPPGKGTGLGLAVVSEIAKSHRGSLHLQASQPRGTRASLRIPLGGEVGHA